MLLAAGVLIGVVLTSDLGWLPTGIAVPDSVPPTAPAPVPRPVSTAVQPSLPGAGGQSFVDVAKAVKPAVVNIFATRNGSSEEGKGTPFEDPFFRRFFGEEWMKRFEAPKERKERGLGSGVIVDANGLIITNNHVVNKADDIKVFLSDKREFKAKLVGTDAKTDVAVLKIEATGLPTVAWADSDKLEVGEFVLAVGNPFGLTQTVTLGIVSALGRAAGIAEYEDFIQTDAAINPGNSGGALVNVAGELVGINTAVIGKNLGVEGIGFAIPVNLVRGVLQEIIAKGRVVRGWIGVVPEDIDDGQARQLGLARGGVVITNLYVGSPAQDAGLRPGDLVIAVAGTEVASAQEVLARVAQAKPGSKIELRVQRGTEIASLSILVTERPRTRA